MVQRKTTIHTHTHTHTQTRIFYGTLKTEGPKQPHFFYLLSLFFFFFFRFDGPSFGRILKTTLADRGRVAQWLRCCATNRKVAGSIPDGVIGIFH